jgi:hypothetical protein
VRNRGEEQSGHSGKDIELIHRQSVIVVFTRSEILAMNRNGMISSDASAVPGNSIPDG